MLFQSLLHFHVGLVLPINNAKADAEVTSVTGQADAGKILAVGNAEAEVTRKKRKPWG